MRFVFGLFFLLIITPFWLLGQGVSNDFYKSFDDNPRGYDAVRIMFYNVENLFNLTHDSLKKDDEFLPDGIKNWNKSKYWAKQQNIAQVITAVGGWEMPTIVGLAEVENIHTLINLVGNTQLKNTKYKIVHHESPDWRGIDVAMLYRPEKFKVLFDSAISIEFPFDTTSKTRDILYVKGVIMGLDTIHLFVTHWPSKYGGAFVSAPKRMWVAQQVRSFTNTLLKSDSKAKILIMGDLNDAPNEESLCEGLEAVAPSADATEPLFNLMLPMQKIGSGTHFYKGATGAGWSYIDQFVMSQNLYQAESGVTLKNQQVYVFRAPFLLEINEGGHAIPNRTYLGMKYHGGYSDHLPIYLDLEVMRK